MSIRLSMCDIGFCILLARKSQHASSHIGDRRRHCLRGLRPCLLDRRCV
jgi:hypothetical protein